MLLLILILTGCNSQQAKPAPPAPDYKAPFPIEEVMGHIIMPNADLLWGSVATTVTAKGVETPFPKPRKIGKEFARSYPGGSIKSAFDPRAPRCRGRKEEGRRQ